MKKLTTAAKMTIVFAAGTLSGMFIRLGVSVTGSVPRSPGGDALILPLIVLLIVAGYWVGAEFGREAAYRKGYRDGRVKLLEQQGRHPNCRCTTTPYGGRDYWDAPGGKIQGP